MNMPKSNCYNPQTMCRSTAVKLPKGRRGTAFLLLVVALVIVVMACTQAFVRAEVTSRRNGKNQRNLKQLQAAIDATRQLLAVDHFATISLPLNEETAERIEITRQEDAITARWMQGDTETESLTRTTQ